MHQSEVINLMEKNNKEVQQERETVDYLTEAEARKLKEMFKKHFKSYKKKIL